MTWVARMVSSSTVKLPLISRLYFTIHSAVPGTLVTDMTSTFKRAATSLISISWRQLRGLATLTLAHTNSPMNYRDFYGQMVDKVSWHLSIKASKTESNPIIVLVKFNWCSVFQRKFWQYIMVISSPQLAAHMADLRIHLVRTISKS